MDIQLAHQIVAPSIPTGLCEVKHYGNGVLCVVSLENGLCYNNNYSGLCSFSWQMPQLLSLKIWARHIKNSAQTNIIFSLPLRAWVQLKVLLVPQN